MLATWRACVWRRSSCEEGSTLKYGPMAHRHFLFSHLQHQRPCLRGFFEIMDNIALLTRRPSSLPHNFQTFSFKLGLSMPISMASLMTISVSRCVVRVSFQYWRRAISSGSSVSTCNLLTNHMKQILMHKHHNR